MSEIRFNFDSLCGKILLMRIPIIPNIKTKTKQKQTGTATMLAAFAVTLSLVLTLISTTACSTRNNTSVAQPYISDTQQSVTESDDSLVEVPDLRGYMLEALMIEFENLGFVPHIAKFVSDEPVGTVLSIEQMGQFLSTPAAIEIFVSAGLPDWEIEAISVSDLQTQQSESPSQQQFEKMEFGGISWLILDETEDKVLLLSEFILFDRVYNNEHVLTSWETSSLRSYLNDEFLNSFSTQDRERIAETRVLNPDRLYSLHALESHSWYVPSGNDTDDRIFILNIDEIRYYFENESSRKARVTEDHYMYGETGNDDYWWWVMRSPGSCTATVGFISSWTGSDWASMAVNRSYGIRPALWLYID
jgi:hypothetical protein